jgi:very-short-patch-repair endonuclease
MVVRVIRFSAVEVLDDLDSVIQEILLLVRS